MLLLPEEQGRVQFPAQAALRGGGHGQPVGLWAEQDLQQVLRGAGGGRKMVGPPVDTVGRHLPCLVLSANRIELDGGGR